MVKFTAIQSAKVLGSKAPKPQDDALGNRMLIVLKENPKIK